MEFFCTSSEILLKELLRLDDMSALNFICCCHFIKKNFPSQTFWKNKLMIENPIRFCHDIQKPIKDWLIEYQFNLGVVSISSMIKSFKLCKNLNEQCQWVFTITKYVTQHHNGRLVFMGNESCRSAICCKFMEFEQDLPKYGLTLSQKSKELIQQYL